MGKGLLFIPYQVQYVRILHARAIGVVVVGQIPVLSNQSISEWPDFVHPRIFTAGLFGDGGLVLFLLKFAAHCCGWIVFSVVVEKLRGG